MTAPDRTVDEALDALQAGAPNWGLGCALDVATLRAEIERLRDGREAAEARVRELRCELEEMKERTQLARAEARVRELEDGLRRIAEQQPRMLATLRANGVVFDGPLGRDPKNWEHVAFSIYNALCEVDTIARALLADKEGAA